MTPNAFWASPIADLTATAQAIEKQRQEDLRMMAWLVYGGAALMAVGVNDPKHFPPIHTAFPGLFEEAEPTTQDWKITKQRIEDYAAKRKQLQGAGG